MTVKSKLHGNTRTSLVVMLALVAALATGHPLAATGSSSEGPNTNTVRGNQEVAREALARLPLRFEANLGQTDGQVKFVSRGSRPSLLLTSTEAVIPLPGPLGDRAAPADVVRIRLVGADQNPRVEGVGRLPGVSNYLFGGDPKRWVTSVPSFAKVRYHGVYPGIDVVYYGDDRGRLEYDFVVAPGADHTIISLELEGQRSLALDSAGDLVVSTANGELRQNAPFIYQEIGNKRQQIEGGYVIGSDGRVRLEVADFDRGLPLVIDPVITYSTFVGGGGTDQVLGIATDTSGSAYVTGSTTSVDFPVAGGEVPDSTCGANGECDAPPGGTQKPDVFVSKLSSDGRRLEWSTYLGGSGDDRGIGIALDSARNVYITGRTDSYDNPDTSDSDEGFPTTANALDRTCGSDGKCNFRLTDKLDDDASVGRTMADMFMSKLAPHGSNLEYSTYLGGSGDDARPTGMSYYVARGSLDQPGDVAEEGVTGPTAARHGNGGHPGAAGGLAVTGTTAYVTGSTLSPDFPTSPNALDSSCGSDGYCDKATFTDEKGTCTPLTCRYVRFQPDVFLTKIDTGRYGAASLLYSSYLGGSGAEAGYAVAVSPQPSALGHAFLTGFTASPPSAGFPTTSGAYQSTMPAPVPSTAATSFVEERKASVPFLTRIDTTVTNVTSAAALRYSTFVGGATGGANRDTAYGIGVDASNAAYLTGQTDSIDFPTKNAYQRSKNGATVYNTQYTEAFVTKINTETGGDDSLGYSTYLGGVNDDTGRGIALDDSGRAYVTGQTLLSNPGTPDEFPTKDPIMEGAPSAEHSFLTVFEPDGSEIVSSTTLGGTHFNPGGDRSTDGRAVALGRDSSGLTYAYVAGTTGTSDLPTVNPHQSENAGYRDGFIVKISPVTAVTPVITAIAPSRGGSAGGTEVVIRGTNLTGAIRVTFGKTEGELLEVSRDGSRLKAVSPPGIGEVDVRVTTALGTSPPTSLGRFIYTDGVWEASTPSETARYGHTATTLTGGSDACGTHCGKLLLIGGAGAAATSAELYDPGTGGLTPVNCVARPSTDSDPANGPAACPARGFGHSATALLDGTVLVVSGSSAQIYAPTATGSSQWRDVGKPIRDRLHHSATLITGTPQQCGGNCGKVLVVGGWYDAGGPVPSGRTAELYDPMSKTWSLTTPPMDPRLWLHTATLITGTDQQCGTNCGRVLLVGGASRPSGDPESAGSAELFDPKSEMWTGKTSVVARYAHTTTTLSNGRVLIAGGIVGLCDCGRTENQGKATSATEIYDPDPAKSFEEAFSVSGQMLNVRSGHVAVPLPDGRALVVGGADDRFYDPALGENSRPALDTAEIYDPHMSGSGGWRHAGTMLTARGAGPSRGGHSANLVVGRGCGANCGKVLVFGGASEPSAYFRPNRVPTPLADMELYTPGPYISTLNPTTGPPQGGTTVTLLGSGYRAGDAEVSFGDEPAEIASLSFNEIKVKAPPVGDEAIVDLKVLVPGLGLAVAPAKFSYNEPVGAVSDLLAEAVSGREVILSFGASGFPPSDQYVVKQARFPISEADFEAAQPVCQGGVCKFTPRSYQEKLTVSVGGLTPDTTYYYALRVRGSDGALGPMSNVTGTTTARVAPGQVDDLVATAISEGEVRLTFSAPGSDDADPPPAARFVVKQSAAPIVDASGFDQATSLCGGECILEPSTVGQPLSLSVSGLRRQTYHYALRAVDDAGNLGPISNRAWARPDCAAPAAGPGRVVYPPGYHLVGVPEGTRVPAQSVLYGWFDLGRGGRYSTQEPAQPTEGGRGYWAWFSCPRAVEVSAGAPSVSLALGGYRAAMVGNPSGTAPVVVSGHDFTARWDPLANGGSGGYRVSGYQEQQTLAVGEGIWAFSYRDTIVSAAAR